MPDRLAQHVLEVVRGAGYALSEERAEGGAVWRLAATSAAGETWVAEHEDRYRAAVLLAEAVGVDLEE